MKSKTLLAISFLFPFCSQASTDNTLNWLTVCAKNSLAQELILTKVKQLDGLIKNISIESSQECFREVTVELNLNESDTQRLVEILESELGDSVRIEKVSISDIKHGTQDWMK